MLLFHDTSTIGLKGKLRFNITKGVEGYMLKTYNTDELRPGPKKLTARYMKWYSLFILIFYILKVKMPYKLFNGVFIMPKIEN